MAFIRRIVDFRVLQFVEKEKAPFLRCFFMLFRWFVNKRPKNYYYLPSEDRAVHKSVGTYVEKDHRCKASPENCYYPMYSVFLPLPRPGKGYGFTVEVPDDSTLPLYRRSYEDKDLFLNFDDLFPGPDSREQARLYVISLIHAVFLKTNKEKKKNRHKTEEAE